MDEPLWGELDELAAGQVDLPEPDLNFLGWALVDSEAGLWAGLAVSSSGLSLYSEQWDELQESGFFGAAFTWAFSETFRSLDLIVDISEVEPANIRAVTFLELGEVLAYAERIGLLEFTQIFRYEDGTWGIAITYPQP